MLIARSPELTQVLNTARMIAATDACVLILGESGTGKDLLAHVVHQESRRHNGAFVAINCAALPDSLFESELFGYRKGAFTGATQDRDGRIGAAEGGTLFLDEIGELSLNAQAKLLRLLETRECQRLGDASPYKVDIRVVAATNRDLSKRVAEGLFRADLYYRLNVVPLEVPPLRERPDDILPLINHFNRVFAETHGLPPVNYEKTALRALKTYNWPGNVRELRNHCERMAILFAGKLISPTNLPREIAGGKQIDVVDHQVTLPAGGICLVDVERSLIEQALSKTQGNRSRAAKLLGLSRDTLLYRMRKYALR